MPRFGIPQILLRPSTSLLVLFSSSTAGGYAYRSYASSLSSSESGAINPHDFSPYTLVSKQPVSSTSSIFMLRPRYSNDDSRALIQEARKKGVWSVQAKQPQLQIARSYTPLPATDDDQPDEDVRILIRREEAGEMSNYLHKLPEETTVDLRGPYMELEIPEGAKEVLFLAGGTGIAPALQAASLLAHRKDMKLHILWANRRREDCMGGESDGTQLQYTSMFSGWKSIFGFQEPSVNNEGQSSGVSKNSVVQTLDKLKSKSVKGTLSVEYFIDEEGTVIKPANVLLHTKQLELTESLCKTDEKYILVSGPDGFIEHWAGRKAWIGGREVQGPLGGVLAQIELPGWKVVKL